MEVVPVTTPVTSDTEAPFEQANPMAAEAAVDDYVPAAAPAAPAAAAADDATTRQPTRGSLYRYDRSFTAARSIDGSWYDYHGKRGPLYVFLHAVIEIYILVLAVIHVPAVPNALAHQNAAVFLGLEPGMVTLLMILFAILLFFNTRELINSTCGWKGHVKGLKFRDPMRDADEAFVPKVLVCLKPCWMRFRGLDDGGGGSGNSGPSAASSSSSKKPLDQAAGTLLEAYIRYEKKCSFHGSLVIYRRLAMEIYEVIIQMIVFDQISVSIADGWYLWCWPPLILISACSSFLLTLKNETLSVSMSQGIDIFCDLSFSVLSIVHLFIASVGEGARDKLMNNPFPESNERRHLSYVPLIIAADGLWVKNFVLKICGRFFPLFFAIRRLNSLRELKIHERIVELDRQSGARDKRRHETLSGEKEFMIKHKRVPKLASLPVVALGLIFVITVAVRAPALRCPKAASPFPEGDPANWKFAYCDQQATPVFRPTPDGCPCALLFVPPAADNLTTNQLEQVFEANIGFDGSSVASFVVILRQRGLDNDLTRRIWRAFRGTQLQVLALSNMGNWTGNFNASVAAPFLQDFDAQNFGFLNDWQDLQVNIYLPPPNLNISLSEEGPTGLVALQMGRTGASPSPFQGTAISHLGSLADLDYHHIPHVTKLVLPSNAQNLREISITHAYRLTDLTALARAQRLFRLSFSDTYKITSFESIASLVGLRQLSTFGMNAVNTLHHLSALTNLEELRFRRALSIPNINDLRNLKKVSALDIGWCSQLTSLSPTLESWPSATLKVLKIDNTSISSLAPLSGKSAIEELELRLCSRITSLRGTEASAGSLKVLHLDDSGITDFRELSKLTALEVLSATRSSGAAGSMGNLASIASLANLHFANLAGTGLDDLVAGNGDAALLKVRKMGFDFSTTTLAGGAERLATMAPKLAKLTLRYAQLTSLAGLAALSCLRVLVLCESVFVRQQQGGGLQAYNPAAEIVGLLRANSMLHIFLSDAALQESIRQALATGGEAGSSSRVHDCGAAPLLLEGELSDGQFAARFYKEDDNDRKLPWWPLMGKSSDWGKCE